MEEFAEARAEVDTHLAAVGVPPIRDDEFIALRLYTGPMFEKYCAVLRGLPGFSAFLTSKYEALCAGNRYCATIHAINDALIKLSRVSTAQKLYRGLAGFRLPATFLTPDEFNVPPADIEPPPTLPRRRLRAADQITTCAAHAGPAPPS